jgi:NAD(P)H dehydrogenase (quinone)
MLVAVTGAGGQLGGGVVAELVKRVGAGSVRALSRTPARIAEPDVDARHADFDDPEGLVGAFAGADRLLLVSTDRIGHRVAQHRAAVAAAARAGVGHVFYTSAVNADDPANPAPVAPDHRATEEALAASGLPWTALRYGIYTETLLLAVRPAVAAGVYASNGGDGAISYVPRSDLAAVTAAVLAHPADPGRVLELTGPEAVTGADVAAVLTGLSGREIRFQPLPDEVIEAGMSRAGLPAEAIAMAVRFGRAAREGYLGPVTDTVRRYLGREPTSVAQFLARHRDAITP